MHRDGQTEDHRRDRPPQPAFRARRRDPVQHHHQRVHRDRGPPRPPRPVGPAAIGGQDVVGSLGVVNDQGVLLHPDVAGDEVLLIEEVLGVPPMVGTVSFGSPYVGAGICASNDGAVAGSETTGPELNRIEDALGII